MTGLAIISIGAVFAGIVFLDEVLVHRRLMIDHVESRQLECRGYKRHLRDLFQNHSVMDRVSGVSPPCERAMVPHKDSRRVVRVHIPETLDNHIAGFLLVLPEHFRLFHVSGARNIIVEIVGMGCADVGNIPPCLGPSGSVRGVGMNHSPDIRKCLI